MQKILSSFVFRDYRQYSPEQLQIFRRANSRPKQKISKQSNEATAATNQYKNDGQNGMQQSNIQNVLISQFDGVDNTKQNDLVLLGKVIQQIEQKIQITKQIVHSNAIIEQSPANANKQPQTNPTNEKQPDITDHHHNQQKNTHIDSKSSYLKEYRLKMTGEKQRHKNKFKLQQFKKRLNSRILMKIVQNI